MFRHRESFPSHDPSLVSPASASVLLVDDSDCDRVFTDHVLQYAAQEMAMPLTVQHARDGEEGLRLLHEGEFRLAVVDATMPKLHGVEMISCIHPNCAARMRVVVRSAGLPDGHEVLLHQHFAAARVHAALWKHTQDMSSAVSALFSVAQLLHPVHAKAAQIALSGHTEDFFRRIRGVLNPALSPS